jgi:hypothetical protein
LDGTGRCEPPGMARLAFLGERKRTKKKGASREAKTAFCLSNRSGQQVKGAAWWGPEEGCLVLVLGVDGFRLGVWESGGIYCVAVWSGAHVLDNDEQPVCDARSAGVGSNR